MKPIECRELTPEMAGQGIRGISAFLDKQVRQHINQAPWSLTGHKPEVSFTIAHDKSGIYLKYRVLEKYTRAFYKKINDPVYKDSCVEFFIAFNDDASYYNLEFNCAGVALGGFGLGKLKRQQIPEGILQRIEFLSDIKPQDPVSKLYSWELTLAIPFGVFAHQHITGLSGQNARANFYKCGDDLPDPHFLVWAPIEYPHPEFHLPEFFGTITFL